ncbi:MAG TPA: type II secretion system protein [Pyrinomonadaceae bacterium]|nr:type II secretion system protein [Pyrinomonadaceae bacterium]
MTRSRHLTAAPAGERGYALVALLAVMAIIAIVVTSAAPRMQQQAQRELEKESIARGEEVAAAIYQYTRGMGRLPTSMDELLNGYTPPGSFKTIYPLRKSAARDPLATTRDGEWKLVRQNDRVFSDFVVALTKYNGGTLPTARIYPGFMGAQPQQAVTGLVDLKNDDEEEPPGGEDNESNVSGPFIGVASRSRRKSVLHYYGVERHDRWVFTPLYR